jgi:hypothetical protein
MLPVVSEDPAQLGDGLLDGALRHDDIRPNLIEQVLYINDAAGVRCEIQEEAHGARLHPDRLPLARELIELGIDPPLTNAQDLWLVGHRMLSLRISP